MTTLYLTEPGTVVRYRNEVLLIYKQQKYQICRLSEVTLAVVLPGVQLTDVAIAQLLDRGIETIFLSRSGQFRGRLQGQFQTNPTIRIAQYRALESDFGMALARKLVLGKVRNQRTLLQQRNRSSKGKLTELEKAIDSINNYIPLFQNSSTVLTQVRSWALALLSQ